MKSTRTALLLILTFSSLNTCGVRHTPVPVPVYISSLFGEHWYAVEDKANHFMIFANGNVAKMEAIKTICKNYICFGPELAGSIFTVERKRK